MTLHCISVFDVSYNHACITKLFYGYRTTICFCTSRSGEPAVVQSLFGIHKVLPPCTRIQDWVWPNLRNSLDTIKVVERRRHVVHCVKVVLARVPPFSVQSRHYWLRAGKQQDDHDDEFDHGWFNEGCFCECGACCHGRRRTSLLFPSPAVAHDHCDALP